MIVVCVHCLREQEHPLADIITRLDRIERLVRTEGAHMAQEIDDVQAAVAAEADAVAALAAGVQRLEADFATLEGQIGGATGLSDADRAQLLATLEQARANTAALGNLGASVDAADPVPVPPVV